MYVCTWLHQYNNQISADFWHKTLFLILWDIMGKTKNSIYWRQTFIQRSKPANNFQMLCSSKSTADLLDLSNDMYIKQKHSEVKVNNNNKKKAFSAGFWMYLWKLQTFWSAVGSQEQLFSISCPSALFPIQNSWNNVSDKIKIIIYWPCIQLSSKHHLH